MQARQATVADAPEVVRTLAEAFFADPVWAWAFDNAERRIAQYGVWFRLLVNSALERGSVWTTDGQEAVSVWVPPGAAELNQADEARLQPMLEQVAGPRVALIMEAFERFELAHPHEPDHHYLSLLATRPDRRGHGIGMQLLTDNLRLLDGTGAAAYLESTNPANLERYRSVGFEVCNSFDLPDNGPTVITMWRTARGAGGA